MADFKYEIVNEIGVLSENTKGWRKELNLVSWNGADPKYDLRDWLRIMRKWERASHLLKRNCAS